MIMMVLLLSTVLVLYLSSAQPKPRPAIPAFFPALGLVLAVFQTVFSFVMKGVLLKRARASSADSAHLVAQVLDAYRRATIIAMALCEGGAMLALVMTFVAGGPAASLVGLVVPLGGMVFLFPSRVQVDQILHDIRRGS